MRLSALAFDDALLAQDLRRPCSKVRMNSRPMILRLVSGSVTPASAVRNCSSASTMMSFAPPVESPKACSICSDSSWRMRPWFTYTQVRRSTALDVAAS